MGQSYDFTGIASAAPTKPPFNGPRLVTAPSPTFDFSGIPTAEESVAASRQQLSAANANYTAHPPEMQSPQSQWTASSISDRALQGLKGEIEGFAGGLAATAMLPVAAYSAVRHPVATAEKVGTAGLILAGLAKQAIDDPKGALSALQDAATKYGLDPEKIGATAGAVDAALAAPAIAKAAAQTRIGRAVSAGISAAADRIPGMLVGRETFAGVAPASPATTAGTAGITEDTIKQFATGQPMSASDAVDILKAVPKEQRAALLAERAKVTARLPRLSRPGSNPSPAWAPEATAPPPTPTAPVTATVEATPTPTAADYTPSALQKMFGMKPGVEPSPTQLSSSVRLAEIRAKVTLTAPEKVAVTDLVKQGVAPEVALTQVKPVDPAADLMNRWGLSEPTVAQTRFPKGMRGKPTPILETYPQKPTK